MDPREVDALRRILLHVQSRTGRAPRVLEWGSGGSTIWFREFGADVTSIEHDPRWARISGARLVPPNSQGPYDRAWADRTEEDPSLVQDYVFAPRGQGKFDVVLVDGRARSQCVLVGWSLLEPHGYLFLHDARRYRAALTRLEGIAGTVRVQSLAIATPAVNVGGLAAISG